MSAPALTDNEHQALALTGDLMRTLAQAGARAYPDRYRLLGGIITVTLEEPA